MHTIWKETKFQNRIDTPANCGTSIIILCLRVFTSCAGVWTAAVTTYSANKLSASFQLLTKTSSNILQVNWSFIQDPVIDVNVSSISEGSNRPLCQEWDGPGDTCHTLLHHVHQGSAQHQVRGRCHGGGQPADVDQEEGSLHASLPGERSRWMNIFISTWRKWREF